MMVADRVRRRLLVAALGFVELVDSGRRDPALAVLHQCLASWAGIGLVAVGMHRQGDVLGGLRPCHA